MTLSVGRRVEQGQGAGEAMEHKVGQAGGLAGTAPAAQSELWPAGLSKHWPNLESRTTTLLCSPDVAMHSMISPLMYACGSLAGNATAWPGCRRR